MSQRSFTISDYLNSGKFLLSIGSFIFFLGSVVIFGWYAKLPLLIQLNPSFVPMQYNTALGLTLCGLCLILNSLQLNRPQAVFASLLFLLGSVTLSQYLFKIDTGLDQLFMDHYITVKTSHPGRMAPNTAICFTLMAILSLNEVFNKNSKLKFSINYLVSSTVLCLSTVALMGNLLNVEGAYGWQKLSRMAMHTSFGFFIQGLSVFAKTLNTRHSSKSTFLPIFIALVTFSVFTLTGQVIKDKENKNMHRVMDYEAEMIGYKVESDLKERIEAFIRLSQRVSFNGFNQSSWLLDAATYYQDFKFYESLAFYDKDNKLKWIYPKSQTPKELLPETLTSIKDATLKNKFVITNPVQNSIGDYQIIFLYPIIQEKEYKGSSIGSINIKIFLNTLLTDKKYEAYDFNIYFQDELIYISETELKTNFQRLNFNKNYKININDIDWQLEIIPTQQLMESLGSTIGEILIALGLLISTLAGAITYFYQEAVKARDRARIAERAKANFLANMSHEIRTPMNGILGMAEILMDDIQEENNREKLEIIRKSGDSLLVIINDILDYSKIEAGKVSLESSGLDIRELLQDQISLYSPIASKKGIQINLLVDYSVPHIIKGDQVRLKQIVNNLLSNAVKFTIMGNVEVKLVKTSMDGKNEFLHLTVKDSGIGISEEDSWKLFKDFTQIDSSTTRRFGGTGLGLSICKKLVELMKGKIYFNSKINEGATFHVQLPLIEGEVNENIRPKSMLTVFDHSDSKEENKQEEGREKIKVLVVDDVKTNQFVVSSFLSKLNCKVSFADNGLEALDKAKEDHYHLVFMDCHMPIMNGFESTEKIIEALGDKRPKIIALSASAMKEDMDKCYASGMDDFLAKPINREALAKIISKYSS